MWPSAKTPVPDRKRKNGRPEAGGAAHRGVFRTARAPSLEQFRPRPYLRIPTSYWAERLFILILGPIVNLRGTWEVPFRAVPSCGLCSKVLTGPGYLSLFTRRKGFWVPELAEAWSCGKYSSRNVLIRERITYWIFTQCQVLLFRVEET